MKFYVTSSSRWLAKLYQAMGQPEKAVGTSSKADCGGAKFRSGVWNRRE